MLPEKQQELRSHIFARRAFLFSNVFMCLFLFIFSAAKAKRLAVHNCRASGQGDVDFNPFTGSLQEIVAI